jgi:hypothetical protein
LALSEIFAWVTAIEYAYEHAPKDMKTVVQAISLLIAGMGSAVAMSLTTVSRDPNMVIFYACLAGAMAVTVVVFYCIFRNMDNPPSDGEKRHSQDSVRLQNGVIATNVDAARHLNINLEPAADLKQADSPTASPDSPAVRSSTLSGLDSLTDRTIMRTSASTTSTSLYKEDCTA